MRSRETARSSFSRRSLAGFWFSGYLCARLAGGCHNLTTSAAEALWATPGADRCPGSVVRHRPVIPSVADISNRRPPKWNAGMKRGRMLRNRRGSQKPTPRITIAPRTMASIDEKHLHLAPLGCRRPRPKKSTNSRKNSGWVQPTMFEPSPCVTVRHHPQSIPSTILQLLWTTKK